MSGDKKLFYFLVGLIIFLAIILLIKIKTKPKYDPRVYAEIYDEYEELFGKDNTNKKGKSVTQNEIEENTIQTKNNSHMTSSNVGKGKVIGKIIIPKIDIQYPIIKETTPQYLKVAPTKYCGPEVNEIRKFSYSGA